MSARLTSLLLAASALRSVTALPSRMQERAPYNATKRETITSSGEGTVDGYFYSLYIQDSSGATFDIEDGSYSLTWDSSVEDVVAGIGWETGSARDITYSGSWETDGNAYLSVYGWTTDPLVEYYITDSYGDYNPGSAGTYKGSVDSDDGTYDIYLATRTDADSIEGTATFSQYWSVRTSNRVGGTITTKNHFDAWEDLGMDLGTYNYQILATEGYESSGSSSITVSS
ncbi:xylanase B [Teratosphaeria destructans]|uniref:Endo-1,4-beta-xylanase n=1 Tax=Teratosphaeria destructans TaxID=418781 RepID=A0A9W7W4H0_9PEZI|nr:xylanase B [Teratosphaeria destructans]